MPALPLTATAAAVLLCRSAGCAAAAAAPEGVGQEAGHGAACPQPTLLTELRGHTAPVLSLALSPDGALLYSGSHDYTVRAWATADWRCVRVLKGHGGGVRALAVAPDGGTLYSAAGDNTLRVGGQRQEAAAGAGVGSG